MTDYLPDQNAKDRIANAVRAWERIAQSQTKPKQAWRNITGGFWAVITASDGTTNNYSWVALAPNADGTWSQNPDWGQGSYSDSSTMAAKCIDGCPYVRYGIAVWLEPAPTQDFYVFQNPGGVVQVQVNTFTASGEGSAETVPTPGQTLKYTDISGGNVNAGTLGLLSYSQGQPATSNKGTWYLTAITCQS